MTTDTSRTRDVPTAPSGEPVVRARAVVKSYDNVPALRGVGLTVHEQEVLAVTGPSGSGKSTVMLCLAGILRPDAGTVDFRDLRVSEASEPTRSALRRHQFGVLFQFGQLVPDLTAEENVALPLLLSGVRGRPALTAARAWLDRFGVADLGGTHPGSMSGGQSQRVAVARAMVTEPEVLFADEPTGALDTLAGEQVLGQLVRVSRESATAVVLVTHEAAVAAYADREIVLRDGRLDGDGPLLGAPRAGRHSGGSVRVVATESALAAGIGTVAATVAYFVLRAVLDPAVVPPQGRVLPTNVLPTAPAVAAVLVGLPLAAGAASALALRRVVVDPFGVTHRRRTRPPAVAPAVLLAVGAAGLIAGPALLGHFRQSWGLAASVIVSLLLFGCAGLGLIFGTAPAAHLLGRWIAPRTGRADLLICARRLIAAPFAASRAGAGVLLAVLIGAIVQGVRANFLLITDPSDSFYADTFRLVDVALAAGAAIGAASLLVACADGIVERRRTFAALVATGTPRSVLARAALAEILLPLTPVCLLAAAVGIGVPRGMLGTTVSPSFTYNPEGPKPPAPAAVAVPVPWTQLGILVGGALVLALLLTAASLVLLRSATDIGELRAAA